MILFRAMVFLLTWCGIVGAALAGDGNRLVYLDESDPYYVSRTFPRLTTPQWVGEEGVEAVVILAIDDMRGSERWEAYLRPILDRLKQIDGRAPVSIMTCQIDPADPHLQTWLKEGLSLEIHTFDHPCPLLKDGDFAKAKGTYDHCVDLLAEVPGNAPVAFRMPCCDSLNTPSPRFYSEIFNSQTPAGRFLSIDTSVFNVITPNDPELPRELVLDAGPRERFRKYIPFPSFANTIEDYPYPYVIGKLCWEFPCVVPSDWSAQNIQQPNNPRTVEDLKAALDAVVLKQGVYDLVFHPHGWIRNDQIVELIDHAVERHGPRVKFLTFKEALERLNRHLLAGQPLRAADGGDNGVRVFDANGDGFCDVTIGNDEVRRTRIWQTETRTWTETDFPAQFVSTASGTRLETGLRFGIVHHDGRPSCLVRTELSSGAWIFDGSRWSESPELLAGLECDGQPILTSDFHPPPATRHAPLGMPPAPDRGVRLRDLDGDGRCELLAANESVGVAFRWDESTSAWKRLGFDLPPGAAFVDVEGRDRGLRLIDFDDDLCLDLIFSHETAYGLYLFDSLDTGWSRKVKAATRDQADEIPMIVRGPTSNGAWFHSRHLWIQNEDTARLKDLVDRRSYHELLQGVESRARSPAAGLASLTARPGFQVEQVAAEPLVMDPVALDWGPDGKLWVVEMADYPLGLDGRGQPGGRVRYLEDTDGDGRYDSSTLFLDGLNYPNGVTPWRGGVLVSCAPDIFFAEDTDGDGKADRRETLYTGFVEGNQQHRANGFCWGLDNWLHCANGDSGGAIKSLKTGDEVELGGRDFRIRPDTGEIEPQTGQSQFGRVCDNWGNWFGSNNSNPGYHFVLDERYLNRNEFLVPPGATVQLSVAPGAAPVFPLSRTVERFNDLNAANRFTSACGLCFYRDDLFGPEFTGNSFICEPVHNLVHREVVSAKGVTFTSRRADDERESEFLASTDNWFRPTMARTGPDGALWVADMYRAVIEHPEWIPAEFQEGVDLRAGHDKGRIYRVYPVGKTPRGIPRLDRVSTARLVGALESPNGWQRDMAQRVLLWRDDPETYSPLLRMAAEGRRATARLHALCTLDGLRGLATARPEPRPPAPATGLEDPDPGVRRHAARLWESHPLGYPEAVEAFYKLADDPDPFIRLQMACTLGEIEGPEAGKALGRLAVQSDGDEFLEAAILSSAPPHLDELIAALLASESPPERLLTQVADLAASTGDEGPLAQLARAIAHPGDNGYDDWQFAALAGLLDSLDRRETSLAEFRAQSGEDLNSALEGLAGMFDEARTLAADETKSAEARSRAIRILGRGPGELDADIASLADLLTPRQAPELQLEAVASLGRLDSNSAAERLISAWGGASPRVRSEILAVVFSRPVWILEALAAVDRGEIAAADLDAARRQRLLEHPDATVRDEAKRLFDGSSDPDRARIVEQYATVARLTGDAMRGVEVFGKRCAACHKLKDQGTAVGPDLAALTDRSAAALVAAIFDPNKAVETKYLSYAAETRQGLILTGMLESETGASVTLVTPEGKREPILRNDLVSLASSGKSLMPEGLEKDLAPQDVADLVALLSASGLARKSFDGNEPRVVLPERLRREFFLLPSDAEIYGDTLVFEETYNNLGFWGSGNDHAVWTIDVPHDERYTLLLEYACDDQVQGNAYVIEVSGQRFVGTVGGTGTWDVYHRVPLDEIDLTAGRHKVSIRSEGPITGYLMDLKSIGLRPVGAD